MVIKRKINAFKVVAGRLEYAQVIKDAVLNPRIQIKNLHINGGFDWIDQKYGFIKLLLNRGQIAAVETHSDLMACDDYLKAIELGVSRSYSFSLTFTHVENTKKTAYASQKRMDAAREKWIKFCAGETEEQTHEEQGFEDCGRDGWRIDGQGY